MNKPKHFLIFKIIGLLGIIIIITGTTFIFKGFGDFESNLFMIGGFLIPLGTITTALGISIGFSPEIAKAKAKSARYIQEENKDDLKAITNNTAEIMCDAVATTANAFNKNIQQRNFCKHCGQKIDNDSQFCSSCGKEL